MKEDFSGEGCHLQQEKEMSDAEVITEEGSYWPPAQEQNHNYYEQHGCCPNGWDEDDCCVVWSKVSWGKKQVMLRDGVFKQSFVNAFCSSGFPLYLQMKSQSVPLRWSLRRCRQCRGPEPWTGRRCLGSDHWSGRSSFQICGQCKWCHPVFHPERQEQGVK